jgi:hypothetical protein
MTDLGLMKDTNVQPNDRYRQQVTARQRENRRDKVIVSL